MNHTPWTQEDAEKWAMESDVVRKATFEDDAIEGFKAGMAKAAEMIEAPTVHIDRDSVCTHIAKQAKVIEVLKACIQKEDHRCGIWHEGRKAIEQAEAIERGEA